MTCLGGDKSAFQVEPIIIDRFDAAKANESELSAVARFLSSIEEGTRPALKPFPISGQLARLVKVPDHRAALWWVARDTDGQVLGASYLGYKRVSENPTSARVSVMVAPEHRRLGVGILLLKPLVDQARILERTHLTVTTRSESSGSSFLSFIGGRKRGLSIESHLNPKDATSGIARSTASHPLFRVDGRSFLVDYWEGFCPEVFLQQFAEAKNWMNEAPRGLRAKEAWMVTESWIREEEAKRAEKGDRWWTFYVRERSENKLIAFTDVIFPMGQPKIALHEDVAVIENERCRGIATYLYGVMIEYILSRLPEVSILATTNSTANKPALRINQKFGFVPVYQFEKWELDIDSIMTKIVVDS